MSTDLVGNSNVVTGMCLPAAHLSPYSLHNLVILGCKLILVTLIQYAGASGVKPQALPRPLLENGVKSAAVHAVYSAMVP